MVSVQWRSGRYLLHQPAMDLLKQMTPGANAQRDDSRVCGVPSITQPLRFVAVDAGALLATVKQGHQASPTDPVPANLIEPWRKRPPTPAFRRGGEANENDTESEPDVENRERPAKRVKAIGATAEEPRTPEKHVSYMDYDWSLTVLNNGGPTVSRVGNVTLSGMDVELRQGLSHGCKACTLVLDTEIDDIAELCIGLAVVQATEEGKLKLLVNDSSRVRHKHKIRYRFSKRKTTGPYLVTVRVSMANVELIFTVDMKHFKVVVH